MFPDHVSYFGCAALLGLLRVPFIVVLFIAGTKEYVDALGLGTPSFIEKLL